MPHLCQSADISSYPRPNWLLIYCAKPQLTQRYPPGNTSMVRSTSIRLIASVVCRVLIHAKPAMCQSWDYRAKQGFCVGPALDHHRCYELMKLETKQKVISDMVKLRHTYLQIPAVLADDKIINGLQVTAGALRNAPPPASSNQLDMQLKCSECYLKSGSFLHPLHYR